MRMLEKLISGNALHSQTDETIPADQEGQPCSRSQPSILLIGFPDRVVQSLKQTFGQGAARLHTAGEFTATRVAAHLRPDIVLVDVELQERAWLIAAKLSIPPALAPVFLAGSTWPADGDARQQACNLAGFLVVDADADVDALAEQIRDTLAHSGTLSSEQAERSKAVA